MVKLVHQHWYTGRELFGVLYLYRHVNQDWWEENRGSCDTTVITLPFFLLNHNLKELVVSTKTWGDVSIGDIVYLDQGDELNACRIELIETVIIEGKSVRVVVIRVPEERCTLNTHDAVQVGEYSLRSTVLQTSRTGLSVYVSKKELVF